MLKYDTDGLLHRCVPVAQFALEFVIPAAHWKFTPLRDLESPSEIKLGPPVMTRSDGAEVTGLR